MIAGLSTQVGNENGCRTASRDTYDIASGIVNKTTSYEQVSGSDRERRAARWVLQATIIDMLSVISFRVKTPFGEKSHRVGTCYRRAISRDIDPSIWVSTQDGRASFHGVMRCGSIWACPICEAKISRERSAEISSAIDAHMSNGGAVLFVTWTVGHSMQQPLLDVLGWVKSARQDMRRQWSFRRWLEDMGVIGSITATEVTYGERGWHPHYHELFFLAAPIPALQQSPQTAQHIQAIAAIRSSLFVAWRTACQRSGVPVQHLPIQIYRHPGGRVSFPGVDVQAPYHSATSENPYQDLAQYIASHSGDLEPPVGRWGMDVELSHGPRKQGRPGRLHPWDFARLYEYSGSSADMELCRRLAEFLRAFSVGNIRALVWTRGLRKKLGLNAEKTDAELAGEGEEGSCVHLAFIPGSILHCVSHVRGAHVALLDAAERDGVEGVRGCLKRLLSRAEILGYRVDINDARAQYLIADL